MKNNGRYHITMIRDSINETFISERIGIYPVAYPPTVYPFKYKGFSLFAHRPLNSRTSYSDYLWRVTEKTTGWYIPTKTGCFTVPSVIREVKKKIDNLSQEKLQFQLNFIAKYDEYLDVIDELFPGFTTMVKSQMMF